MLSSATAISTTALLSSRGTRSLGVSVVRCSSSPTPQNGGALKAKGPVIIELPLEQIRRPLLRTRNNDPEKVKELMASIADIGLQEPVSLSLYEQNWDQCLIFLGLFAFEGDSYLGTIQMPRFRKIISVSKILNLLLLQIDVLEVEGFYYGFSGCHRYEAHQRLGLPTIRCKVRRGTKDTLRHHLR
ncbi:sulfiredoxin [Marchantia polymorpha subsp. ruderalis]|uniref:sulfiredoxin n=2 Tax=Marchantia polymorpha TaxID=3197 RepID=A0AAF6B543_MARPO|nr:hypothetical protein MARPO_0066s0018 [Marchantia polymorpha]BBN07127.1 hypothetical protein Mp_4g01250 [Marchantia polymorpha subsp. ruderalis]|eukprot:PTQ36058.1 hypothetical protein MARPO_0066s0018 [Marchantia polymorpha]